MPKASINIDVSELKILLKQINSASLRALRMVDHAITKSAYDIDRELKEIVQKGSRSGKVYYRGGKSGRRSAAGEPPKTDTGRLLNSIRPVTSFMAAEVGSLKNVAQYGDFLESGTGKMAARPYFKPVHDKYEPIIAERISTAIKQSGIAS